jgi:hypothetical protein
MTSASVASAVKAYRRYTVALLALIVACNGPSPRVLAELKQRSAYVRALAQREGFPEAWSLNSRDNVSFESGWSNVQFVSARRANLHWYDVPADPGQPRGIPVRFMNRSVHLRLRGDGGPMTLALGGRISMSAVFTKPRLEVSLDGELLASQIVEADGSFALALTIPAADVDDWADVYVTWNTLEDPERDTVEPRIVGDPRVIGESRIARLEYLHWEPAR